MAHAWNDREPIYRQLRDRVLAAVLDGELEEGSPLPSVRQTAAELSINPITVSKAYEELVGEGLVEKRRGIGLFVRPGARKDLLAMERQRFFAQEWPAFAARLRSLDLDLKDLPFPILPSKDIP